jgi:hypothetical protein
VTSKLVSRLQVGKKSKVIEKIAALCLIECIYKKSHTKAFEEFLCLSLLKRCCLEKDGAFIKEKNPKGLAQVVKALVLRVCSLQGLKFNTSWVQTAPWGHWTGDSPLDLTDVHLRETPYRGPVHP